MSGYVAAIKATFTLRFLHNIKKGANNTGRFRRAFVLKNRAKTQQHI